MKKIKKLLTLILVLSLAVMPIKVYAAEPNDSELPENITIMEDNNDVFRIKEVTENGIIISSKNKSSGVLTVEEYDANGDVLLSKNRYDTRKMERIFGSNPAQLTPVVPDVAVPFGLQVVDSKSTWSGYEFYCFKDTSNSSHRWQVKTKSGSHKHVVETYSNKTSLNGFRTSVNTIKNGEYALAGAVGTGVAIMVINILAGQGVGAAVAAVTGAGAATAAIITINSAQSDCNYYYSYL